MEYDPDLFPGDLIDTQVELIVEATFDGVVVTASVAGTLVFSNE